MKKPTIIGIIQGSCCLGDITAEYQQHYIDANQAELTALKELANERVAKATKILQDAGVM